MRGKWEMRQEKRGEDEGGEDRLQNYRELLGNKEPETGKLSAITVGLGKV